KVRHAIGRVVLRIAVTANADFVVLRARLYAVLVRIAYVRARVFRLRSGIGRSIHVGARGRRTGEERECKKKVTHRRATYHESVVFGTLRDPAPHGVALSNIEERASVRHAG